MPTTWLDTVIRQTRRVGSFPFPHQAAFLLNNPVRRTLGRPGSVIDRLELGGTERILEIGPGSGFFSVELAARLTTGRLELFDVQPQMLEKARRGLASAGYHDVGFRSGDAGAGLPYPDASFDVAFLASVLGEVPDEAACIEALARVVRPGGQLVFVEVFGDPDRQSPDTLRELVEPRGFEFLDLTGSPLRDVVRFRRVAAP